jgi:hypothetical protein
MNENDVEIEPHPDFVNGFNLGYLLAEHEPELAIQIADKINFSSERSAGFTCGIAQYAMQKDKTLQAEWTKGIEPGHIEPNRDVQPDRDDLELELD